MNRPPSPAGLARLVARDNATGGMLGALCTLRSTAVGTDETALAFLSFDVLVASSVMNGEEMPDSPLMDSKGSVEEFARLIDDYSRRMDLKTGNELRCVRLQ
jgi:hypothetical protein